MKMFWLFYWTDEEKITVYKHRVDEPTATYTVGKFLHYTI